MSKRKITRHKERYTIRFGITMPMRLAFTEDISSKGLFIQTNNTTPVGTRLLIDIILPNNDTVSLEGIVRWVKRAPDTKIDNDGLGVEIKRFIAGGAIYKHLIADLHAKEINQTVLNCAA